MEHPRIFIVCLSTMLISGHVLPGCKDKTPETATETPPRPATAQQPSPSAEEPKQRLPLPGQIERVPPSTAPSSVRPTTLPATAPATQPATHPTAIAHPPAATAPADDPKVATFAGLKAPKPVTWIWHPPSKQFNIAEYGVPGRDGHNHARIAVITAGGTLEANIQRWRTMFRAADDKPVEPKIEKLEADEMAITLVEFAGAYQAMGSPNFVPDQLFLAAIVPSPIGQIVIRFVGPAGTVEPNRAAFMDMIRGLKRVEPEK